MHTPALRRELEYTGLAFELRNIIVAEATCNIRRVQTAMDDKGGDFSYVPKALYPQVRAFTAWKTAMVETTWEFVPYRFKGLRDERTLGISVSLCEEAMFRRHGKMKSMQLRHQITIAGETGAPASYDAKGNHERYPRPNDYHENENVFTIYR